MTDSSNNKPAMPARIVYFVTEVAKMSWDVFRSEYNRYWLIGIAYCLCVILGLCGASAGTIAIVAALVVVMPPVLLALLVALIFQLFFKVF